MMNRLDGIYKEDFFEVKKCIEKFSAKCSEREEALESLSGIYLEAQEKGAPISEIHEGTAKDYAKEICESLPKKKKPSLKKILPAAAAVPLPVPLQQTRRKRAVRSLSMSTAWTTGLRMPSTLSPLAVSLTALPIIPSIPMIP